MKKSTKVTLAVVASVVLLAAAFIAGAASVIFAPKWVEEDRGAYLVITNWGGQEWVDIADKASHLGYRAYLMNW